MPKPRFTLIHLPLAGVAPGKLTQFPRPTLGSVATVRQQLRTVAQRVAPPIVPTQAFKIKAQPLTPRSLASIANVARSSNPGEQLIKQEKWGPEQLVGAIYTAFVAQQYKETKTQYQEALRQAARLPLATRLKASVAIEAGFKSAAAEHVVALRLGGLATDQNGLEQLATALSANRNHYQTILDIRAGARGAPTATPTALSAEIVPVTLAEPLDANAFADLQVPDNWCGFDPITGSQSKHFSRSFSLQSTFSYPCGVRVCRKWGIPYPCGVKWCNATVTWAAGSVALSLSVGYKIGCCGGTAWGSGKVEACGTVVNQTLCAGCQVNVTGVIGAGSATGTAGQCAYGLGLSAGVSCYLAGYTVFAANFTFGWVVQAQCPPLGLCA